MSNPTSLGAGMSDSASLGPGHTIRLLPNRRPSYNVLPLFNFRSES